MPCFDVKQIALRRIPEDLCNAFNAESTIYCSLGSDAR